MTRRHPIATASNARVDQPATSVRVVHCPQCGGDSVYAPSNPYRPFCSQRCKNIDFGAWADESFRVAQETEPDAARENEGPLQ